MECVRPSSTFPIFFYSFNIITIILELIIYFQITQILYLLFENFMNKWGFRNCLNEKGIQPSNFFLQENI